MGLYGYGTILDVSLSTGKLLKRDLDLKFAREYVGGMGFASKILYDEVGPEVDPLGPGNIVVFALGPLTGTQAPCAARTETATKSPLTGHMGCANTGGMWGTMLKRAGFVMLIVRGKAEKPVYLWINNDLAVLRDAGHLWGRDTRETADIIKNELESPQLSGISVLAIGPAGENMVRYACALNDQHHVPARSGIGAVMGSKNLKAIAVRGTGEVNVARPEQFREATRESRDRLVTAANTTAVLGTKFVNPSVRGDLVQRGGLPGKNFQTGVVAGFMETRNSEISLKYITKKEGTCHACPISCFDLAEVNEGKYAGLKVSRASHTGVVIDWGAKVAIDNIPAIWKCKELCQSLGMDYNSAAGTVSFAMELFQRGIITKNDTDGLELGWGNEDVVHELLRRIAFRQGFGTVLAEGSLKAAKMIGKEAERFAMTTRGMEMSHLDPRIGPRGWVFGDLTSPRGGDNVRSTHFRADRYDPRWWIDKYDMFPDVKEKIYAVPPEETVSTWAGKPTMCIWFEDLFSALNTLGVCIFPASHKLAIGPTYLSKLFSACTGWDTSPEDIMKIGEKSYTLCMAYSIRQGLTRKDAHWPDRFYSEPLPEGPAKGAVLSREVIDQLLDEYYALRGWNKERGVPTARKLIGLGLFDLANDLLSLGKIPE